MLAQGYCSFEGIQRTLSTIRPARASTPAVPGTSSRFVFALPQPDGTIYVGLTDEEADGDIPDVPQPSASEIGFLLDVVGAALEKPLRRGRT